MFLLELWGKVSRSFNRFNRNRWFFWVPVAWLKLQKAVMLVVDTIHQWHVTIEKHICYSYIRYFLTAAQYII